jgi:predicted permease
MPRILLALYRRIARASPRRLRDQFADEQVELFEQIWRDERPAGRVRRLVFAAGLLAKAALAAIFAWGAEAQGAPARWRSDFRVAIRSLFHSPWYAMVVVGVLGAGITLATVVFAMADGVLFRALPFGRPVEIHLIRADAGADPQRQPPAVSGRDIAAWMAAVPELQITVIRSAASPGARRDGRDYFQRTVDERFFEVVGRQPMVGGFTAADFDRGSWAANRSQMLFPVVVSHAYWTSQLGADPAMINRPVITSERDGEKFGRIVRGVLPPDFAYPLDLGEGRIDMLQPMSSRSIGGAADDEASIRTFQAIARVPAHLPIVEIEARLTSATRELATKPFRVDLHGGLKQSKAPFDTVRLIPIRDHLSERSRPAMTLAALGAGVLVLLACVNAAGLTVARGMDRSRELAVRRALGATSWALARSVLVEVVVLIAFANVIAALATPVVLAWTVSLLPDSLSLIKTPVLDARVFAAAGLIGAISVGLVMLWPAVAATRVGVKPPRLAASGSRLGRHARMSLVAGQVALCFVLLMAGGLTLSSLARSWRTDLGYQRANAIILEAFSTHYAGDSGRRQVEALREDLRRVPGVARVAATNIPVFSTRSVSFARTRLVPVGASGPFVGMEDRRVDFDFFAITGLRVLEGRLPDPREWEADHPVAIVSHLVARQYWPNGSAVGQKLVANWNRPMDEPARTVAAVVNDTRFAGVEQDAIGMIYTPGAINRDTTGSYLFVQTSRDAGPMVATLAAVVKSRGMLLERASTFDDAVMQSLRHRMLPAWVFGSLGTTALAMLAAGVLGLLVMATAQRTREIGIRIALGSSAGRLTGLLVREHMQAVGLGLTGGAVVALLIAGRVESELHRVSPFDPLVWAGVALVTLGVAGLGVWLPARWAARLDPIETLRTE